MARVGPPLLPPAIRLASPLSVAVAALFAIGSLGCGGPQIPKGDGYRAKDRKGWKRAKKIEFDEAGEAEVEGSLSYPRRHRARWYRCQLPGDGELTVKMDVFPIGEREDVAFGFEVLDANYNVINRVEPSSAEEDEEDEVIDEDADELQWTRTLYDLAAGKYYLHLYLNGRLDAADYDLQLKYAAGTLEHQSNFPAEVPFLDPLPIVPALDDSPGIDCGKCSCRRDRRCRAECSKCKKGKRPHRTSCSRCDCSTSCASRCTRKCGKAEPASPATAVRARITRPVASGSGTRITMNRGSANGVAVGWKGQVVDKKGKPIDNGRFTVTEVRTRESVGTVGASIDAVIAAGRVRLTPP